MSGQSIAIFVVKTRADTLKLQILMGAFYKLLVTTKYINRIFISFLSANQELQPLGISLLFLVSSHRWIRCH